MATATYKYARATAAIALAGSSQNWANGANIYVSDNSDAAPAMLNDGEYTNYLVAKDFEFNLSNDAIVTGIQVRIEKEGTNCKDKHLFLTLDGTTLTGVDHADVATAWPGADTKVVHGSTTNEWGLRLTGADVNKACFGVALAVIDDTVGDTPGVDGIEIQLTYTDPTESVVTSSDLARKRDVYRILGKFMADKHGTKQYTILYRNGVYEVTTWSF